MFFSFTLLCLLFIFLLLKSSNRNYTLLFLSVILFPSIIVFDLDCSTYDYLDAIGVRTIIFSIVDVIFAFFNGNYGKSFFAHREWYYDSYFIIEIYSILFFLFLYFNLKDYSISIIKRSLTSFYSNPFIILFLGISFILIFLYYLLFYDITVKITNNLEYSKEYNFPMITYLSVFIISFYVINRNYTFFTKIYLLKVLLIMLFPIISVSDEYRTITNCESDSSTYERIVAIKPLIDSFPETIVSFFHDYNREYFRPFLSIKFYSLFQIAVILLLLPSLLISKVEKNA